ncbi:hypothetical protein B4U84_28485 [Westiellopsis prolifica IICB1]|nr:hypothetical protein B4U84_28485 [Westiellopsis prolifica IICB1]
MEAVGYHGIIPGCFLRRCKIGLSRNPHLRLQNFHDNQPPCDIKILKTIYVEDMEAVETELHRQFKGCQVKLIKSREWFDLYPWQFAMVHWSMSRYGGKSQKKGRLLLGDPIGPQINHFVLSLPFFFSQMRDDSRSSDSKLSVKLILACLFVLAGVGVMLGQEVKQQVQQPVVEIKSR